MTLNLFFFAKNVKFGLKMTPKMAFICINCKNGFVFLAII